MKKFVSVLLVLTMVLAVATTAVAACSIEAGMWVEFKKDSPAFTEAKSSKETRNVVAKRSYAPCDKVCGKYARLIVNSASGITRWFKTSDLKETSEQERAHVIWAKGGRGMSSRTDVRAFDKNIKGKYVKVSGHTNLRRTYSLHCKGQGVVEKGKLLKLTGNLGIDDRYVVWLEVCYKGKKLWLSSAYIKTKCNDTRIQLYDKNGNKVDYED